MSGAAVGLQPCPHGKSAICKFTDSQGKGCRWADGCRYCHVCRRVTTYSRIRQVLTNRRQGPTNVASTAGLPGNRSDIQIGLLGLLGACPELLLEGFLGEALPPAAITALPAVHPAIAALVAGGASLLLWRLQIRRLRAKGLSVSGQLLNSLSPIELRRAARAFESVLFKTDWHFDIREEMLHALSAVERAQGGSAAGSQLFALTCRYRTVADAFVDAMPAEQAEVPITQENAMANEGAPAGGVSVVDVQEARGGGGADDHAGSIGDNVENQAEDMQQEITLDDPDNGNITLPGDLSSDDGIDEGLEEDVGVLIDFQLVTPIVEGRMQFPDGEEFLVAPIIYHCQSNGGVLDVLAPATLPTWLNLPQNAQLEGSLWSASPSVCAFEDVGLLDKRSLTVGEVQALLGSRAVAGSGRQRPACDTPPLPLRVVVAIRCVQRFWQLTLS